MRICLCVRSIFEVEHRKQKEGQQSSISFWDIIKRTFETESRRHDGSRVVTQSNVFRIEEGVGYFSKASFRGKYSIFETIDSELKKISNL